MAELYHKTNAEIRKKLIEGTSLDDLKDTIASLTHLSKEISKRRISLRENDSPADTVSR